MRYPHPILPAFVGVIVGIGCCAMVNLQSESEDTPPAPNYNDLAPLDLFPGQPKMPKLWDLPLPDPVLPEPTPIQPDMPVAPEQPEPERYQFKFC